MNRNDYRRALIMLRSLNGSASGYVRLERRTLAGTLQFTLNSAPTGGELYAVLLCRRNGAWHAVKADAFGAPRYGQVGLVWSFDPRNIEGLTLEQYDMAAVVQVRNGTCELLLCGNLNGSVNADCTQLHAAICRLFTTVRISRPQTNEPSSPDTESDMQHPSEQELSAIDIPKQKMTAYAPEENTASIPVEADSQECSEIENGVQLLVGQDIPCIDAPEQDAKADTHEYTDSAPEPSTASAREEETKISACDKLPAAEEMQPTETAEIQTETSNTAPTENSCGCTASAEDDFAEAEQAVLSRSVYSPETAKSSTPDASQNAMPIEADDFDTPAATPVEADAFDTPAAAPIESDDLDTPAQTPVEPDEFDTPALTPIEPDEFDTPASDDSCTPSVGGCSSEPTQAVLSRSVYSPETAKSSTPDASQNAMPIEADDFDTPAATPIEADAFDTPAAAPIESDDLDTPAQTPIEPDEFDTPALTPIEPDEFDTPASDDSCTTSVGSCSAEPTLAVLSRSVYSPETAKSSTPDTAQNAMPIEADAFDTPAATPIEADAFDTPAAAPIESDDLDTPAQTPVEPDEFDTPALTPIEPDEFDIPAAESANETILSTPAKISSYGKEFSSEEESSRESKEPIAQQPSAGQQLALNDPDAAWHESIEPLHRLFFSQEAVVPFEAEGYIFIRAPLYDVENTSSCLVGLYCEDGTPSRVCYAIPADYTSEPPAGLEGYVWRGSHTRGYWVICEAVPSVQ